MACNLSIQALLLKAAPIQALLVQILSVQAPDTGFLDKQASKSIILTKRTVTPNKNIVSKEFVTLKKVAISEQIVI